eukprot:scaffold4635_cov267-Pinguiococcus_pyrenoidosus.AAC.21
MHVDRLTVDSRRGIVQAALASLHLELRFPCSRRDEAHSFGCDSGTWLSSGVRRVVPRTAGQTRVPFCGKKLRQGGVRLHAQDATPPSSRLERAVEWPFRGHGIPANVADFCRRRRRACLYAFFHVPPVRAVSVLPPLVLMLVPMLVLALLSMLSITFPLATALSAMLRVGVAIPTGMMQSVLVPLPALAPLSFAIR